VKVIVGALIFAGVLLGAFVTTPLHIGWAGLVYLGLPVGLATAFVVHRRFAPAKAALAGGLVAGGVIFAVFVPALLIGFLLGDLASDEDCDGFCHSNTGGLIFGLFVLPFSAVPVAIVGGIISAIASFVGVRPTREA